MNEIMNEKDPPILKPHKLDNVDFEINLSGSYAKGFWIKWEDVPDADYYELNYSIRYSYGDEIKTQESYSYKINSGNPSSGGWWEINFKNSFYIYGRYLYVTVTPVRYYNNPDTNEIKTRKAREWFHYYDKRPDED